MKKLLHSQSQPMQLLFPKQERRSRRNLLLRLIIGTTTLLVSTTAYYSYQIVRSLVLENLKENAWLAVKQGVDEIDSRLAAMKERVETIANSPVVRSMDWPNIEPYLQLEVDRQTDFYKLDLADPDGSYSNTVVGRSQSNVSDRTYFRQAMAGKVFVSDPIISRSTGKSQIIIAAPILSIPSLKRASLAPERQEIRTRSLLALNLPVQEKEEAQPIGVFFGSVTSDRVTEIISQLQYGDGSYAFALNSQGLTIAHPNPEFMSTKEKPASSFLSSRNGDLAALAQGMVKGQQGMELVQIDGSGKYVAYLPFQQADWSVALVIPRGNIESQLRLLDRIALAVVGLTIILIAVLWRVQSLAALEQQNQQLKETLDQLKQTQAQLVQAEKMSSLGQMVAGVAHEINNPINFIFGNIQHARNYFQDLLCLIELYSQECSEPSQQVEDKIEEIDLNYLKEDLEQLFASMGTGCDRINSIVQGLRTFSRLDEAQMKPVDIHVSIDSTLMLLQNHLRAEGLRRGIEVIKDYGDLPIVTCYASQLNQVFFHILSNAIDALSSRRQHSQPVTPTIRIYTEVNSQNHVIIRIADNGEGMTAGVKEKIFDPFFTTKPVGKGTGLGLAISYQIVVGEHEGKFTCDSELGRGTELMMEIPISPLTATPVTV